MAELKKRNTSEQSEPEKFEFASGHSKGVIENDEDDFKALQDRVIGEMYDENFKHFSKWIRGYYAKQYPRAKMREINYNNALKFAAAFLLSISMYIVLHTYFSAYAKIWFLPFFVFNILFVVTKEDIAHARSHWTTNMTGSAILDNLVDWSMMALAGISKDGFRRRHVAAHYADIGNLARMFSDVWLPFVTLPPVFYFKPWHLLKIFLDAEFCKREKLSRLQIGIDCLGLYTYTAALLFELYHGSYFLLCFHMFPLLYYHSCVFLGALVCHSGIDKRNSFNSNGIFDLPELTGLFKVSAYVIDYCSAHTITNHGIHHAYTQLPLEIITRDYKILNKHILDNYKGVRFNNTLTMIIFKDLYARCGQPKWYDYVVQFFATQFVIFMTILSVIGVDIPPGIFEPALVDWRIYLHSTRLDRYSRALAMYDVLELKQRTTEERYKNANALFWQVYRIYSDMKNYLDKHHPGWQTPKLDPIAPADVLELMVKNRGVCAN